MNQTYEWLYDNYAHELQKEFREVETAAIEQLAETIPLSVADKVALADCLAGLRLHCGTESFALGLQLGLHLTEDVVAGTSPTAF